MRLGLFLIGIALPLTWAWIPYIGQESHKHLRPSSEHGEWDLLQLVSLDTPQAGVSPRVGGPLNTTSYHLKDQFSQALISASATAKMLTHLSTDISCYFVFRQQNNTVATLLSAGLPGSVRPWLQVTSDLQHRRLQLVYRVKGDTQAHQLVFPLPKKTGATWTKALLSVSASQAKLWVNCDTVEKRPLVGLLDLHMPKGSVIHFSQAPAYKKKLLGSVQVAKLFNFTPSSRLWRCVFDGQFGPGWKPPLIG